MIPDTSLRLDYPKIDEIYARFVSLEALRTDHDGFMLLYSGLDAAGLTTVMAANVAGAASLGIEADAAVAKQSLRAGVSDFVVHSLDEALRILKNEIRQHRAVSVIVMDDPEATLAEIAARGVQPEILATNAPILLERGAKRLQPLASCAYDGMLAVSWSVPRESARWLPLLDRLAVRALQENDGAGKWRVRWVEASPRYLGRSYGGQRYARMTPAEADRFVSLAERAVDAGEIQTAVAIERNGEARVIES